MSDLDPQDQPLEERAYKDSYELSEEAFLEKNNSPEFKAKTDRVIRRTNDELQRLGNERDEMRERLEKAGFTSQEALLILGYKIIQYGDDVSSKPTDQIDNRDE